MPYDKETADRNAAELKFFSVGACPGCYGCMTEDIEHGDQIPVGAGEAELSSSSCDLCDTNMAGWRGPAHYVDDDGEIQHLEVCVDCTMYVANGELPED